ncbi:MAG: hypothetical protein ACI4WG_06635 [Erysipelotrichaceae bacterium]
MKKTSSVLAIVLIIIGVFALFVAGFFWFAYTNTLDGSADTMLLQKKIMYTALILGLILLAVGIALLVISKKA